jgi:uncharacterized protein YndB with AHSA1/START domain
MVRIVDDEGVFPAPREKVWRLLKAHYTDATSIHPMVKAPWKVLRKEGDADLIEQLWEMGGQNVKIVTKFTANPPEKLTIDFLEGPMIGRIVNTYTEVPGGTRVVSDCTMQSQFVDDRQLEGTLRQFLNDTFDDDVRYLLKMK